MRGLLILVTALAVLSVASANINWNLLTAAQLAALPTSDFKNITVVELSSIPSAACAGFQKDQITTLPIGVIYGFTDAQIGMLPGVACSGFTTQQILALNSSVVAAMTNECIANFTVIPGGGCSGISDKFLAKILLSQVASLSAECIAAIPSQAFAAASSQFYGALNPATCSGFWNFQASYFTASAAPYFSSKCVANFQTNSTMCNALRAEFIGGLTPEAFGNFSDGCVSRMSPTSLSLISGAQFQRWTIQCGSITEDMMRKINSSSAYGVTAECLTTFTKPDVCDQIQYGFLRRIPAAVFGSLQSTCVSDMAGWIMAAITPDQMKNMSLLAFYEIRSLDVLQEETAAAISLEQWYNVGPRLGGASGKYVAMALNKYGTRIISRWTDSIIGYSYIDEFMEEYVSVNPVNHSQVRPDLPWNQNTLDSVTWIELALTTPVNQSLWLESILAKLPNNAVSGFRADQIQSIVPGWFNEFNDKQAKNFRRLAIGAMSGLQIAALKPETFKNIDEGKLKYINPDAIPSITADQLTAITPDALEYFTCQQLRRFTPQQLNDVDPTFSQTLNDLLDSYACPIESPTGVVSPSSGPSDAPKPNDKLTTIEIVLIACGSGVIVIALVCFTIMFAVKKKYNAERAPLLGAQDGRVNAKV